MMINHKVFTGIAALMTACMVSSPAFAQSKEAETVPELQPQTVAETVEPAEEIDYDPLTPAGNLTLVDDVRKENGKQFITMVSKSGNYFYLVIDRDKDGNENVHFLNLVDEADLLALMEEEEAEKYLSEKETDPAVVEVPETAVSPEQETSADAEPETKTGIDLSGFDKRCLAVIAAVLLVMLGLGGGTLLKKMEYFSNISAGNTQSFILRPDANDQKNIEVQKVSDETMQISVEEMTSLIREKVPEGLIVSFSGIDFELPTYYYKGDGYDFYDSSIELAGIKFSVHNTAEDVSLSDDKEFFQEASKEDFEGLGYESLGLVDSRELSVAGHEALAFTWSLLDGNTPYMNTVTLIHDSENQKIITVYLFHLFECENEYKCLEDYFKMLENAKHTDSPTAINDDKKNLESIKPVDGTESEESENRGGISDEFKKAMDGYEEYFDEYIQIMEQVKNNPSDLALISKYTEFMGTYADTMAKFEAIEDSEMTDEEAAYYIEVQNRINQKLLSVQ